MDEYAPVVDAMTRRIQGNRRAPATAQAVAGAIADAVEAGHPPMRLNATADAEALVAERRAMNDVEWERSSLAFMELG
jgi:hypothetical protein